MSDHQEGPGWWLASDGRWYPPDQAPAVPPLDTWATPPAVPPPTPPGSGMSGGKMALAITGMVGVALLAVAAIFFVGQEDDDASGSDGSTSTTTTASTAGDLPDGFEVLEGVGVSIAGPESWVELDAEAAAMTAEEFRAAFPDAPESLLAQGAAAVDQGSVLVAFDPGSGLDLDNVNVIEMPQRVPLSVIEAQARSELGAVGAEVAGIERDDVPAGDALRAEYTLEVALPDGAVEVVGVQYYVVTDESAYVVTFTGPGAVDLAARMMDTFRTG